MKSFVNRLCTGVVTIAALLTSTSQSQAADVTLDGFGSYSLSRNASYIGRGGPAQSGRYRNLGSDYYKSAVIRMDFITNRSFTRSGSLSFELWAMPYYGATSGIILMTRGIGQISGNRSLRKVSARGSAISLDERRFPEFNLFEYTWNGWESSDYLSFSNRVLF